MGMSWPFFGRIQRFEMMEMQSRRGFALPAAVFALVVVGVLVTGGFYLARQEMRIGVASRRATTAFYLAERGANEVMSVWDPSTFGALANWGTTTVTDTTDSGIWSVDVTRMSSRLYFLLATGKVDQGSAVYGDAGRMVGIVARLRTANVMPDAALTTIGELTLGGASYVIGYDSIPGGWGAHCSSPGDSKPGILIDDTTGIKYVGVSYQIDGDPPIGEDTSLTSENLLEFGDLHWDELVALADIIYQGPETITQLVPDSVDVEGTYLCKSGSKYNWGDPENPTAACGNHFPIIYATSDLKIAASDPGQGILLIGGDLEVSGGHEFYGPVIIRGTLTTTGTGGHFNGGVIAANVNLESSTVLGDALVQFSSCAVTRAVLATSRLTQVRPLKRRSWVDLSSVISG
jgi:Tfp pilus assembly protein PilV